MTSTTVRTVACAALAALLLSACQAPRPTALNGTYSGTLRDDAVGTLGSHAMEVTTSEGVLDGSYCFVAIDGSTACNVVTGTVTGTGGDGDVAFRVGTIQFTGTIQGNRSIDGRYAYTEGSGSFDMTRTTSSEGASARFAGDDPDAAFTQRPERDAERRIDAWTFAVRGASGPTRSVR
ncbi:MAG: hypothetical protein WD336_00995 [Trueperaceae bacterium]